MVNKFCIEGEYVENLTPKYCKRKVNSIKNQYFIYEDAFALTKIYNFFKIVDLGCGYGEKLIHFFEKFDTLGVDYGENIDHCFQKYSNKNWLKIDLENNVPKEIYKNSLILCVDVIEHLVDPTSLLNYFEKLSKNNNFLIISTPNKNLRKGNKNGPPKAKDHVREWNKVEFQNLMNKFDINLEVYEKDRYLIAKSSKKNIQKTLFL